MQFHTGVYAISNHPIVQVLIAGYVAKVNRKEKLTIYGGIEKVQNRGTDTSTSYTVFINLRKTSSIQIIKRKTTKIVAWVSVTGIRLFRYKVVSLQVVLLHTKVVSLHVHSRFATC